MAKCLNCNKSSNLISSPLSTCLNCIRTDFDKVSSHIKNVHVNIRKEFNQVLSIPNSGLNCSICVNNCKIEDGGIGYCEKRKNIHGKIVEDSGDLSAYYDSLPTNCVASFVCPEKNSFGFYNLAVFYSSCNFNCLFCQNWHYRKRVRKKVTPDELVSYVNERTKCVCFFGGDPISQIEHCIMSSEIILKRHKVRICFETNGSMNENILRKISDIALKSGGIIKFDLKTYNEKLNFALCGSSNKNTLKNFKSLSSLSKEFDFSHLVASTLLVPGYIDEQEIKDISTFICSLNNKIPYSLLGFYPQFYNSDLPITSKDIAYNCLKTAKDVGLQEVNIGSVHLLK